MNRLRFWVIILIVWLIFIFNIERINSPVNIRSYTYIFVAVAAIAAIIPKTNRLSYLALILIPIPSFLLFKSFGRGDSLWGEALPLTVTQVSGIAVTGLISRQISNGLREVEKLVNEITCGYIGKPAKNFSEAQDIIYRELRRARHHQRPLSVVTLKLDESSVDIALPKMITEVQGAMMNEYVLAGVTRLLARNVSDFGTIVRRDNDFVVVLPETSCQEATKVASKLEQIVHENLNITMLSGTASFPEQAVTFEGLLNLATKSADDKKVNGKSYWIELDKQEYIQPKDAEQDVPNLKSL
ncbi:MAG: diguanylate cyclase [Anaerolineae bacterium]|nr:diguanylate cyclase [Anaerolineae bacterium]